MSSTGELRGRALKPPSLRLVAFVLALAAVPTSLLVRRAVSDGAGVNPLHRGAAPSFQLRSVDGHAVSLDGLSGKPVVVNFWGSWCYQCRLALPLLAEAGRRHPEIALVGVLYRDAPADAARVAEETGARWPMLFDPDGKVARAYGVESAPATFFIRPDGTIAADLIGPVSIGIVERALEKILSSPTSPETSSGNRQ